MLYTLILFEGIKFQGVDTYLIHVQVSDTQLIKLKHGTLLSFPHIPKVKLCLTIIIWSNSNFIDERKASSLSYIQLFLVV